MKTHKLQEFRHLIKITEHLKYTALSKAVTCLPSKKNNTETYSLNKRIKH